MGDEQIANMMLEVESFIDKGNVKSRSLTFISEIDPKFVVFQMENSLKVDLNSLQHI